MVSGDVEKLIQSFDKDASWTRGDLYRMGEPFLPEGLINESIARIQGKRGSISQDLYTEKERKEIISLAIKNLEEYEAREKARNKVNSVDVITQFKDLISRKKDEGARKKSIEEFGRMKRGYKDAKEAALNGRPPRLGYSSAEDLGAARGFLDLAEETGNLQKLNEAVLHYSCISEESGRKISPIVFKKFLRGSEKYLESGGDSYKLRNVKKFIEKYGEKKAPLDYSKKIEAADKGSHLEKRLVTGFFAVMFLGGLFFSSLSLTGNVIGESIFFKNFFGPILILISVFGFFVYNKTRQF